MKTKYAQQYAAQTAESRVKQCSGEKDSRELMIRWGQGKRAFYTTASQAINFILLSKESDID